MAWCCWLSVLQKSLWCGNLRSTAAAEALVGLRLESDDDVLREGSNTQVLHEQVCSRWHQTDLLGTKVGSKVLDVLKHVKGNVKCSFYFYCVPMRMCILQNVAIPNPDFDPSMKTELWRFLWSLVLSSPQCRHTKSTLIKNLFSSTGLQHQTELSISYCCLFACAQGFIKPISKKNVRSQSSLNAQRHGCQSRDRKTSCIMHHGATGTLKWNDVGNVKQLLRQEQAKHGMGSLIILQCESQTTHLETIVSIDYLTSSWKRYLNWT